jgi:hypothetical protein
MVFRGSSFYQRKKCALFKIFCGVEYPLLSLISLAALYKSLRKLMSIHLLHTYNASHCAGTERTMVSNRMQALPLRSSSLCMMGKGIGRPMCRKPK